MGKLSVVELTGNCALTVSLDFFAGLSTESGIDIGAEAVRHE